MKALRLVMTAVIFGILSVPLWHLAPPLSVATHTSKNIRHQNPALRSMSDSAVAGFMAFAQNCSTCHGAMADGVGRAPSLLDRPYATDFRDSALFHDQLDDAVAAHQDIVLARRNRGRIAFNEVELMSKFLRESRRYIQMKNTLE